MTIDEMIAVLQAAKAGRAEWRCKDSGYSWSPWRGPDRCALNTDQFEYRVKPEPREWVIRSCILDAYSYAHSESIKVREVL